MTVWLEDNGVGLKAGLGKRRVLACMNWKTQRLDKLGSEKNGCQRFEILPPYPKDLSVTVKLRQAAYRGGDSGIEDYSE